MSDEPPVFKACLKVLEIENNVARGSNDKPLVQALHKLASDIDTTSSIILIQVCEIVLKTTARLLSRSLNLRDCVVSDTKLALVCLEIENALVVKLSRPDTSGGSFFHQSLSRVFATSRESINKLLFLNTAVLEACKVSYSTSGNGEHMLTLALTFISSCLTLWKGGVGPIGATSETGLPALTGPYLAQLIQSCLAISEHRSKEVSLLSLRLLEVMINSLFDENRKIDIQTATLTSAVDTWRTFFPGVFGKLFVGCNAGFKRGTPVLVASLHCLLEITAVVTGDIHYPDILPAAWTSCWEDSTDGGVSAFEALLRSATERCNGKESRASDNSETSSVESKDLTDNSKVVGGVPITRPSSQWRVDTAQRIVQHIPSAYRKVWGTISPSASESKCMLIDSLCSLLGMSTRFLGTNGTVELTLLLLESLQDTHPKVSKYGYCRANELRELWEGELWSSMQSLFMQRFVESIQEIGRLTLFSVGGGHEEALEALIVTALGSVSLFSSRALEQCMTMLVGTNSLNDKDLKPSQTKKYKWGALQYIQRLLLCEIHESSGGGSGRRLCFLASRRYFSSDGQTFVDAGYFRSPLVHLRERGGFKGGSAYSSSAISSSSMTEDDPSVSRSSEGGLGLVAQLANLIGAFDVSLDALVSLWSHALAKTERVRSDYKYKRKKNLSNRRKEEYFVNELTHNIRMAIAATHLLENAIYIENTPGKAKKNSSTAVKCGYCGEEGSFSNSEKKQCKIMLRCSNCKETFYCSKQHQAKHWVTHKMTCKTSDTVQEFGSSSKVESPISTVPTSLFIEKDAHRACIQRVGSDIVASIHEFLQFFLSEEKVNHSFFNDDVSALRAAELLVSSVLELLATLVMVCPEVGKRHLMQIVLPLLCTCMQSDFSVTSKSISSHNGVIRQAGLTTLARLALALDYKSGRDMLRYNLDYIVDDVCSSLRYVRRQSMLHSQTSPQIRQELITARGTDYDDKIIRVVGAVFSELDMKRKESAEDEEEDDEEEIAMILKDMVSEALEAIDGLCTVASNSVSNLQTNSASWMGHYMLAPLLSLMHSLVLRAIPPVSAELNNDIQARPAGALLFPFPMVSSATKNQTDKTTVLSKFNDSPKRNSEKEDTKCKKEAEEPSNSVSGELSGAERIAAAAVEREKEDDTQPPQGDSDDEEQRDKVSRGIDMVRSILDRCCYFLTVPDITAQVMVMTTMRAAFTRLAHNRRILLPAAHRVWPVLMNRMREQREIFLKTIKASSSTVVGNSAADASGDSATVGREAFLLHHLLEFMTLLASLCGDFVNLKFKDDLWKELLPILHVISHKAWDDLLAHYVKVERAKTSTQTLRSTTHRLSEIMLVGEKTRSDLSTEQLQALSALTLSPSQKSPHSMTEKIKTSLLKCLTQLAITDFTLYANDPFGDVSSTVSRTTDNSQQITIDANPLTVVAPVCVFLLLPLLSSCEGSHIHELAGQTLTAVGKLNTSFTHSLLSTISGQSPSVLATADGPVPEHREVSCILDSEREKKWREIMSSDILIDSYSHFSSLFPRAQNPFRSQSTSYTSSRPLKPLNMADDIRNIAIPTSSSSSVLLQTGTAEGSRNGGERKDGRDGGLLLRERSTVIRKSSSSISSGNTSKLTVVPRQDEMLKSLTRDPILLGLVDSILKKQDLL